MNTATATKSLLGSAVADPTVTLTANRAYGLRMAECAALIAHLEANLADHSSRQASDPDNFGHAGDLHHVAALLSALVEFTAVSK